MIGLYVHGSELNPGEISRSFGVEPTASWRKGDCIFGRDGSVRGQRKAGMWRLVFNQEDELEKMTGVLGELGARGATQTA